MNAICDSRTVVVEYTLLDVRKLDIQPEFVPISALGAKADATKALIVGQLATYVDHFRIK